MAYGKTIELFLTNGTTAGIITAEMFNWNGKALKIPRSELTTCNRDEILQAGVYFLFCKNNTAPDSVYIGAVANVRERLIQHLHDYDSEKEKFHWDTAVVFTGSNLKTTHARYLKNMFVEIVQKCGCYKVINAHVHVDTEELKETQAADMGEFIDNAKTILSVLGFVFEKCSQDYETSKENNEFFINVGNVTAAAVVTPKGFMVLKGSVISETVQSSLKSSIKKLRNKLSAEGKVKNLITTEDILFTSASTAANFVLGYSESGPRVWKTKDGRTLKEIEGDAIV